MLKINHTTIFLIDGLGAVFSSIGLVLLLYLDDLIGMPKYYLYLFISIAVLFSIYSFSCHVLKPVNWKSCLTIIALANLSYSILTLYSVYQNLHTLTTLGMIYFVAEIIVILTLVIVELKLAQTKE